MLCTTVMLIGFKLHKIYWKHNLWEGLRGFSWKYNHDSYTSIFVIFLLHFFYFYMFLNLIICKKTMVQNGLLHILILYIMIFKISMGHRNYIDITVLLKINNYIWSFVLWMATLTVHSACLRNHPISLGLSLWM